MEEGQSTDTRHRFDPNAVITPVPVPFALQFKPAGAGRLGARECNRAPLTAMLLIWFVLVGLTGLAATSFLVSRQAKPGRTDPRLVFTAVCSPVAIGGLGFVLYRRWRTPLREVVYDTASGSFFVRISTRDGWEPWAVYRPTEWTLRVHPAEFLGMNGGAVWKGHAGTLSVAGQTIPLVCSRSREKVLAYMRGIPMPPGLSIIEDNAVLRGRAMTGGHLRG